MHADASELVQLRAENRLLRAELAERHDEMHALRNEHEIMLTKVKTLESSIERMRKKQYGWSSERLHPGQQLIDLGVPREVPVIADSDHDTEDRVSDEPTARARPDDHILVTPLQKKLVPSRRGRHPGRRRLPANAEVVVEDVPVPEHERLDVDGQPLPVLGYRTTDKWDYRVGSYLIRRYRLAIYGRPFSEPQDRIHAMVPDCLVPQGKMTDAALIHTVIDKFADHLPLYRQQQRAGRLGFHLSRATLVSHIAAVASALHPLYEAMAEEVRQSRFIHLDDTPVKLLDPGRGHTATARIWVYRSQHETVFQFTTSREGRHPAEFLRNYRGFIVADAYAGHERLYGPQKATPVGCWAHVRRKFHEVPDHEPIAARMLIDIQRLYAVEDDVDAMQDFDERRRMRQARSVPIIDHIRQRLTILQSTVLPASDLGRAVAYAHHRWPTLSHYTHHGMLPIDNNPAENALRPWAVGRKNWLFLGSEAGGHRAAIVATMIENCRTQGINPYAYLGYAIAAHHQGRTDYKNLTPRAYAQATDRAIA